MPTYTNSCQHTKKNGERCPSTCKSEYCGIHMYHINGLPDKKKCDYSVCLHEGCGNKTRSKYGMCYEHSQHLRYCQMKTNKNPVAITA